MRRSFVLALAWGVVAGLFFAHAGSLRLATIWPVAIGFALYSFTGKHRQKLPGVAIAAVLGVGLGWVVFPLTGQFLPLTPVGMGIGVGIVMGVLVLIGGLGNGYIPAPVSIISFAAMYGAYAPTYKADEQSALMGAGLPIASEVALGLLLGLLSATVLYRLAEMRAHDVVPEAEESHREVSWNA